MKKLDFLENYLKKLNKNQRPPQPKEEDLELFKILDLSRKIKGVKREEKPEANFILKLEKKLKKELREFKREEINYSEKLGNFWGLSLRQWLTTGALSLFLLIILTGGSLWLIDSRKPGFPQDLEGREFYPFGQLFDKKLSEEKIKISEESQLDTPASKPKNFLAFEIDNLSQDLTTSLVEFEEELADLENSASDPSLEELDDDLADFLAFNLEL